MTYSDYCESMRAKFMDENPEYGARVFDSAAWDNGETDHFAEVCEDGRVCLHEKGAGWPMFVRVMPAWHEINGEG